jgi:uncharacterized protein (DUF4415 family)
LSKNKKPTVHFTLDPKRPAPLTKKQKEEFKTLMTMSDKQIDYEDIAPLDKAMIGKMYRPRKQQLTLRIDMDVLAWQKSKGRGYQGRINKILRQAMGKDLGS